VADISRRIGYRAQGQLPWPCDFGLDAMRIFLDHHE
jgi:hypothetical protein